ncbi:MAG: iron ABC transporter permease [Lachnospiraceae bacterium]|nr:iron ABC transporter permease [Lachnospiraceae bacterium]
MYGKRKKDNYWLLLVTLGILLILAFVFSTCIGVAGSGINIVFEAVTKFNTDSAIHQVIREMRIPRVVGAIFIGAGLSVSGAILQAIGNNPFADAGLLGINAGAGFMVALATALFSSISPHWVMVLAFIGAAVSVSITYSIGASSKKGVIPVRLLLAGIAVTAFLTALTQGIALVFGLSKNLSFWQAGTLSGVSWMQIFVTAPWMLLAGVCTMFLLSSLSILSLGEERAVGLGIRVKLVQMVGIIISLIFAGCSVMIAGGISFLGLIIPHVARFLVGPDYRKIIPVAALGGALLMVLADLCARMINAPYDTPVGALVSIIGVPFFLGMTYHKRRGSNG